MLLLTENQIHAISDHDNSERKKRNLLIDKRSFAQLCVKSAVLIDPILMCLLSVKRELCCADTRMERTGMLNKKQPLLCVIQQVQSNEGCLRSHSEAGGRVSHI